MTIDFCLPAHNEELTLRDNTNKLINYLQYLNPDFDWNIYIVINGSNDNSINIAKDLSNHKNVHFYNLKQGGKGRAVKYCWQKSRSDYFVYMDVDLAVSLENLPKLLSGLFNGYDLVWGSRHLKEAQVKRSFFRSVISWCYNIFSKLALNHKYSDLQCGFKGIDNKIRTKVLPEIKDDRWFFDTELIMWSKKFNYNLLEIPVSWEEARYQKRKSKVKVLKDGKSFILKAIYLRKRLK